MRGPRSLVLAGTLAFALVAAGCGGGDEPAIEGGGEVADSATVEVDLSEDSISAKPPSAEAGSISFDVLNAGFVPHELHVIETDLAADELPVVRRKVDLEAEGLSPIEHLEEIGPGASAVVTVDLEAGSYVLICNIPAHYEAGMHASFTVS